MPARSNRFVARALWVAPILAVGVALAGCGSGSSTSGAGAGGVAGTTAAAGGAGQHVTVTETEFRLQLSQQHLQAGPTTFVAVNKGHVPHSLEIDGPGVSGMRIAGTIAPGTSKQLTVTLKNGGYELFCPVDGHKAMGMDLRVSVGGGTSGSTTGTTTGTTPASGGGGGY